MDVFKSVKDFAGDDEEYSLDENNPFNSSLRIDSELFKDDENVVHTVISVKRLCPSGRRRGENWDIIENGKPTLRLKGDRFTNKEREFLRTTSGVRFVIAGYKEGWRSINKFKQNIRNDNDYIQGSKAGH